MRIKAKLKGDTATVKMLIKHAMESGRRKDEAGKIIPSKFVQLVTGHIAGTQVFEIQTGAGVSKNPFIQVVLKGRSVGEKIDFKWTDSSGASEEDSVTLK